MDENKQNENVYWIICYLIAFNFCENEGHDFCMKHWDINGKCFFFKFLRRHFLQMSDYFILLVKLDGARSELHFEDRRRNDHSACIDSCCEINRIHNFTFIIPYKSLRTECECECASNGSHYLKKNLKLEKSLHNKCGHIK